MLRNWIAAGLAAVLIVPAVASAQGVYKVLSTTKVGGEGGFDYITADSANRKLYVARSGPAGHIAVYDLDTLKPVGDIAGVSAHGAQVAAGHGFGSSKPISMWDAKTLAPIKKIEVQGNPDGMLADGGNIYVLSHASPNVTVIDANEGTVLGTIDLGGAPEQAVSDGAGRLYIDLEDKGSVAVVDTKTMKLVTTYDLKGKGATCAGLAIDRQNGILFAACRSPHTMVILKASDGTILETLPIGQGSDGAVFNPKTMEAFSSQGDGTITVVKETSPTSFAVEQTVTTLPRAKTITLDEKTGKLFLMTAEYGAAPAAVAGQRPGRAPMVPGSFELIVVGK
jgi:YVTN family beta-propeller protein